MKQLKYPSYQEVGGFEGLHAGMGWRNRGVEDEQRLDKGQGFSEALLGGELDLGVDQEGVGLDIDWRSVAVGIQ